MRYYYDLHIHTALSPCADDDMTPNNIVNMALLKGLDFIAVTDHNAVGNIEAVMECAKGKKLVVVPGIEVESAEEVHLLCLFPTVEAAHQMGKIVYQHLPSIENRQDIFGNQLLYNNKDEIVGCESKLLLTAVSLSLDSIKKEVEILEGVVIPAHIDRSSYSIISNLGFIPPELNFTAVEKSKNARTDQWLPSTISLDPYKVIANSDAHHLGDIAERQYFIDMEHKNIHALLYALKS